MNNGIRIPLEISVVQAVLATALSAIVVPISYRIGQRITEKCFSWIDEKAA